MGLAETWLRDFAQRAEVPVCDIRSPLRETRINRARQVAMFVLRRKFRMSYPQTSKFVARSCHSTAIHAEAQVISFLQRQHPEYLSLYRQAVFALIDAREAAQLENTAIKSTIERTLNASEPDYLCAA